MDFGERLERMFEQYRQQRDGLGALTEKMAAVTATATSARREVEVTVGRNGVVTDVRFPTTAFRRMTPRELGETIMATINEAKADAQEQAAAILAPMMPAGADVKGMLAGKVRPDALMPEQPVLAPSVREQLGLGRGAAQ
jgi:DNA-binding protein YbaB